MTFDFHIHLDSLSPEGQVVEAIVLRDHVSPEEAVLKLLRGLGPTSAQEMIGALSYPESVAVLDDVVADELKPIWEVAAELGSHLSSDERAKLPADLAINHDHYLYGVPKVAL